MKALKWLDKHFEESIMCVLLTCMFVIMMVQILMRMAGNSLPWAEELTRDCLIYSGFLSMGYTVRKDTILKVDILTSAFPKAVQKVLDVVLLIVTGSTFGFLFFHSIELVGKIKATNQLSSALRFPIYLLYVAAVVGFLFGAIRCIQSIIVKIKTFSTSTAPKTNLEKELENTAAGGDNV